MISCDVLIPFYGDVYFLNECISSVISQDTEGIDLKLTVVNDDTSQNLNESMQNTSGSITIVNNEKNLGLVGNWNKCLSLAESEYLHILHYDDLLEKDFYKIMLSGIKQYPDAGMIICKAQNIYDNIFSGRYWKSMLKSKDKKDGLEYFRKGNEAVKKIMNSEFVCSGIILKKEAAAKAGIFKEELKFSPDEEYWARIAKDNGVVFSEASLVKYRFHDKNYSVSTWLKKDFPEVFKKTRMERLSLLSNPTLEDKENEYKKISLMFTNIGYKLYLKDHPAEAKSYTRQAVEIYPQIEKSDYYRSVIDVINGGSIRKKLEKFKSAN